jgi:glutathione synthase/RimK-type ligase-like ATP-grasp enzyme
VLTPAPHREQRHLSHAGPLFAVMTTDLPAAHPRGKHPGPLWQLLAEEAQAAGLHVLFFHPHQVDASARTAKGWLHGDGRWQSGPCVLPGVIVDLVFVQVSRTDPLYAANKRLLAAHGHLLLNPRLPDKRGVWRALADWQPLHPHLPQTDVLQSVQQVDEWLARHPAVFLKPVRGSGGHGVLKVERVAGEHRYRLTANKNQILAPPELHRLLQARMKKERHLLQEALSLFEVEGRKIDLRVVLHRDGGREWQPVATVPRAGAAGMAVTNLAQGGEARTLEWLNEQAVHQGVPMPPCEEIERVAVEASRAVTAVRPTLAFLGLDLALDTAGRLWVLDINPRPGRKVLSQDARRLAFRHLAHYAQSLLY